MAVKAATGFIGKMVQRSNYAYANARVRIRKSKLLPRDTYPKLLKMGVPEITRFIEDTEYGREIDELAARFRGTDLLESSLNVNEERNYAEVRGFAKGPVGVLVHRYLERFQHWNLKTILRGRFFNAKPDQILGELLISNRANYEFLTRLIQAEGTGLAPVVEALANEPEGRAFHKVLREAEAKAKNPGLLLQLYEDALDRSYYTNLLATIPDDNPENHLFLQFVRKEIDIRNLSVLLRFEWGGDPSERALEFMIPWGLELGEADLRRLAEAQNRADFVDRLKEFKIYEELKEALEVAQKTNTLTPVLLALTKSLGDFAQRFSYRNPLSVLPIINYLMRKNLEVRNLRAIARGKQVGLTEDEISNLLLVI